MDHDDSVLLAWDALATCYVGKGLQEAVLYLGKLWCGILVDTEPMQEQLDEMKLTFKRINDLGTKLEDKCLAMAILLCLPDSYKVLQTVVASYSVKSKEFTSETVITQVLAEEQRQKSSTDTAYFAKAAKSKPKAKLTLSKPVKKCDNCGMKGHTKDKCREKGGGREGKAPAGWKSKNDKGDGKSKGPSANIAQVDNETPVENFYAEAKVKQATAYVAADNRARRKEVWVIDSGASKHMSRQCDWFMAYTTLNPPI
jgi:hypothetical protein